jgi:3-hydroxyisobutyrate dehydrogenase-like beta-hydroxyacid dehydrogenase
MMIIGLLHPGAMGAAISAVLARGGHEVLWCPEGRSPSTAARADTAGLRRTESLADLLGRAEVVLSVCPPAAAESVAEQVHGYQRVFVDANAISPPRMTRIAGMLTEAGATVVDAAVIGPPPGRGRDARIYLAGPPEAAGLVRDLFPAGPVEAILVTGGIGKASALKMAYGSFQKASRALAAVSHALADEYGVTAELLAEATKLGRNALADRDYLPSAAARGWRWAPEMSEVADTLRALGLPPELAEGAGAVFERWASDKDNHDLDVTTTLRHLRD